jgi:hypothetical protein
MATIGVVLLGAALVALMIAMEAGALRTRPPRRRGEPRYDPADDNDQCVATTADGQQCARVRAEGHRRYCWQHQRMAQRAELSGHRLLDLGRRLPSVGAGVRRAHD